MDQTDPQIRFIQNAYRSISDQIHEKKQHFLKIFKDRDQEEWFEEMTFCLFTPQSRPRNALKAIQLMKEKNCFQNPHPEQLKEILGIVRFKNQKTVSYLELLRKWRPVIYPELIRSIDEDRPTDELRRFISGNVRGIGMKEASHFLRNTGIHLSAAIIDRHVQRVMLENGLLEKIPVSISPARYEELENKLRIFSGKCGIPLFELDFTLFYMKTGIILK